MCIDKFVCVYAADFEALQHRALTACVCACARVCVCVRVCVSVCVCVSVRESYVCVREEEGECVYVYG